MSLFVGWPCAGDQKHFFAEVPDGYQKIVVYKRDGAGRMCVGVFQKKEKYKYKFVGESLR